MPRRSRQTPFSHLLALPCGSIMHLDIFSDTICPWCYVGKRRLGRALANRPQPRMAIRWRAFQLNPAMPPEGMLRERYIDAKFGSSERARRIYDAVSAVGASEGIIFNFEAIKRTPNTILSEEHTSELQSQFHLVCRLLLEKKKKITIIEDLNQQK